MVGVRDKLYFGCYFHAKESKLSKARQLDP